MHRHRASTLFSAAMVVGLVAIAAACGGQSSSTSAGVLRVANDAGTGSASTMDPYDGNRFWPAINMVFDRLIGVDKDFTPIPELAT